MGLITSKCFVCGETGINMQFETCSNCGRLCNSHLNDAVKKGIFFDSIAKVCPKCGKEVKLSTITKLNNNFEQIKSYNESMCESLEQIKSETEEKPQVVEGCIDGDCINGLGTMIYKDGSKYVGQWKDGKREGQGTGTKVDGEQYVGQWKEDKKEGEGACTFPNGTKYIGQWTNNKRHGQGTLYRVGNEQLTGQWTNDKFIGE